MTYYSKCNVDPPKYWDKYKFVSELNKIQKEEQQRVEKLKKDEEERNRFSTKIFDAETFSL